MQIFIMYKIIGGRKEMQFELQALSLKHAKAVAESAYILMGLIGRYYCEMENGETFQIY
jgi:hypothetical protein